MTLSNKKTNIIAGVLLLITFGLAFFSMLGDSLTFDELAHIPAGYSYLTQFDYRVNPEHPPLVKDLAALPLLFLNLNFPSSDQLWLQQSEAPQWWVQFDLGNKFIYGSGNDPRSIIVFSRLPMIFLLLLLGWFLFKWTKELGGNLAGLIALFIFSFSPVFIANGRLVTTDIGAALGAAVSTYYWIKFLQNPKKRNIIFAGLAFGMAMLMKFSLILLVPFFGIITIIYALLSAKNVFKQLAKYIIFATTAGIIGFIFVVWPIYQLHIVNYPAIQQARDTAADLAPNKIIPLKNLDIWMADKPLLRPFSQYLHGLLMASQRTLFGNTVYFLGNISATGWWYYFPIIYLLKMPLAFHLLTLAALISALFGFKKMRASAGDWLRNNFVIFSFLTFLAIYFASAILGNLNIGIRHILPTIPLIFIMVALGLRKIITNAGSLRMQKITAGLAAILFLWYAGSALAAFPYYIPYYNELAGGTGQGYKYAVDSNYDWGQDFYRLLAFVEQNNIDKIYLDYFGGENPQYWLGDKYIKLDSKKEQILSAEQTPPKNKIPVKGWVAVSANQLMGGLANPVAGFDQETGYYKWLDQYTPVARIGYSIFVYRID